MGIKRSYHIKVVFAALLLLITFGQKAMAQIDSIPISKDAITDIIHYKATDSVAINLNDRQAFLYTDGNIDYQDMNLTADRVTVAFENQTLNAHGSVDSAGNVKGKPIFKQGNTSYNADTIKFNYKSQKGFIHGVITQEGDGFLHGDKIKKAGDSIMYLSSGKYTTCNYDHPHFALNFSKSKLITGKMIVTGPAFLTVEDVPTPLALPFAFFPITKERSSGVLIPSYGWMNHRGYYLRNGGYYFAVNDNMDLSLTGDIYTNLSWAVAAKSNYYKRYKYKGYFDVRYERVKTGIKGDSNTFDQYGAYMISWKHQQDAKANPYSRFSADVKLQSGNFNRTTTDRSQYFNSTTTSSISYSTQIGSFLNLTAAARESFNSQTGLMNIKLPSITLSSTTFYPFRKKEGGGSYKWYENISMSYMLSADNNISAQDSDLFKLSVLDKMQYGIQHNIPIKSNIKVLRFFNWTNSLNYNERWHWSTIKKHWDSIENSVVIDTVKGFRSNRDISFNSSLTTRIYGMFNFKHGPIKALRHVINPSIGLNFRPDFGSEKLGIWHSYTDSTGYVHRYSIFEQSLYGGPADGKSGQLTFNIGNNLEIKVKPLRDTVNELKKIVLLENLNFGMSYDFAKDSLNWSNLNISGRTTLMNNLVLNYSSSFSPYIIDEGGRIRDQLVWEQEGKLFRKNDANWSAQLSWNLNNNTFKNKEEREESNGKAVTPIIQSPYNHHPALLVGEYVDFSMPWNLSVSYTLNYVNKYVATLYNFESEIIQTISLSGNFDLTENWKFSFSTGYDFVNKGMSYTSIDIYRDLHCWEMRFGWIPFGVYKSWNFQINIKAPSLRDVKYEKREDYLSL